MKHYKVYFEIGGKKLVKKVLAIDEGHARQKILEGVSFHKIEPDKDPEWDEVIKMMSDILR